MREELIAKIQPILSEFIDKSLDKMKDVEEIRKSIRYKELEIDGIVQEQDKIRQELKQTVKDRQESLDRRISEANDMKNKHEEGVEQYKKLRHDLNLVKAEIEHTKQLTNTEYLKAKEKSDSADRELEQARTEKKKFEIMSESLWKDRKNIDDKKTELELERKKLNELKLDIERKEAKVIEQANDLNDKELELKAREKEVERQIKRYNLKQIIGAE